MQPGLLGAMSIRGLVYTSHTCIGGKRAFIVNPSLAAVSSPMDSLRKLRSCTRRLCRAALELVEILRTEDDVAGVSGGLAYDPRRASDIDIAVYGPRIARVYRVLRELRQGGITAPYLGEGHGWSRDDYELNRAIAEQRYLLGYYKGFEYNVRLVYCMKPSRCMPIKLIGVVEVEAKITTSVGFSTPSLYMLRVKRVLQSCGGQCNRVLRENSYLHMMSYRLRYAELPEGSTIVARGELELHEGVPRLIPDHAGYVRLLSGPGAGRSSL